MNVKVRRFKICRWIFLTFAIILNSFLIVYSCFDNKTTTEIGRPFTNFFTSLINAFTHKEIDNVPLQSINASFSSQQNHQYNYLPGYELNEIPLGSAKQIECSFNPENATNKTVKYVANPSDNVVLNQSGSTLSIVGLKVGDCKITAKSNEGNFESSIDVRIVETVAPQIYDISLEKTEIAIGTTQTISFDIDGGVLTHDELINFRYYDTKKLTYSSSNSDVATVDTNGVVRPVSIGYSTITVSNGDYSKSVNVSVIAGSLPDPYTNLRINGSNVCYANDMILDQRTKKNHYQLIPYDGNVELKPDDFIWESSNDLLAKVDKHGVLRGFRKVSDSDETVTITAISKLTGQIASFVVVVKDQLPSTMNFCIVTSDKRQWDKDEYSLTVGDDIKLIVTFDVQVPFDHVVFSSSDDSIIEIIDEGNQAKLLVKNVGTCNISVKTTLNNDLFASFKCVTISSGAISSNDIENVGVVVRKSIGHAAMFMIAQIFTYLTLYMFFYDKKWWFYSSISLGEGMFISGLSELIQVFVPSRGGAFVDVLIDFAGVVVGAALTFLGIYIVKKIKEKKSQKETSKNN